MKDISNPAPSAAWYADWLKHRNSEVPLRSIVIGAKCSANLQRIGAQVANYLNEFDSEAEGHWRAFSADDLRHCAGDPTCRDLVLSGAPCELHPHSPDTDIERLAEQVDWHSAGNGGHVEVVQARPDLVGSGTPTTKKQPVCCREVPTFCRSHAPLDDAECCAIRPPDPAW